MRSGFLYGHGFWWSRGWYGFRTHDGAYVAVIKTSLHPPLFSERNGYSRLSVPLPYGWRLRITS